MWQLYKRHTLIIREKNSMDITFSIFRKIDDEQRKETDIQLEALNQRLRKNK